MRKLFLTSAGLPLETAPFFSELLDRDPQELKLAMIPTAGYPEIDKVCLNEAKEGLGKSGFQIEVIDLKVEDPKIVKSKLEKVDIINVGGGNTFFLLYWVRKCGLDKYLKELIDQGKIYIGVSAGSIIMGPNIELSGWKKEWDENVVNLKDPTGLNLVPFAVSPHFVKEDLSFLKEKSKTVDYPIIAINDTQAVMVVGNEYKIVGKGEEKTFNS
ncbi:MAG TPA: Type 1 glutamine amidotransferase-like domain-containing protein [Patescibacteria group bacterium]|nr:Type 1 glutamine amidotransferase-like domain-containing protein [Patescibacteria group bacterium]